MRTEELFTLVFVTGIAAGVFVVFQGLRQRTQQLEMQHRERLAMIERGQIPLAEPGRGSHHSGSGDTGNSRSLSVGIIVVGFGAALAMVIGIAGGNPEVGIGLGGAIAMLGGAFIVKSLVVRPASSSALPSRPAPPSGGSTQSE